MGEAIGRLTGPGSELLLGRRTYEMFAAGLVGAHRTTSRGFVLQRRAQERRLGHPARPRLEQLAVLGSYDPGVIRRVRDEVEGSLYVSGSGTLVRALLRDGLVDGLHLFVFPVVLGAGERLFTDEAVSGLRLTRDRGLRQRRGASRVQAVLIPPALAPKGMLDGRAGGTAYSQTCLWRMSGSASCAPRPTRCGCRCSPC